MLDCGRQAGSFFKPRRNFFRHSLPHVLRTIWKTAGGALRPGPPASNKTLLLQTSRLSTSEPIRIFPLSILTGYRSSGRGAGPPRTLPSASNEEPWQGQANLLASDSQWYAHPKCVHWGANASTVLSSFLTTQVE